MQIDLQVLQIDSQVLQIDLQVLTLPKYVCCHSVQKQNKIR